MSTKQKTRSRIAIIVVTTWILSLVMMLVLGGLDNNVEEWVGLMKEFSAVTSGIVGAIVGYYFGKEEKTEEIAKLEQEQ